MKFLHAKILDTKESSKRRSRHILANSGEIMESGETRDLENLFVMSGDGELIRVADLNSDPDAQMESYSVKAQADHGEVLTNGEIVPSVEKQFGSCKVWLEDDGLHAKMFFADDDKLADHAWAISQDASYSVGIDWYPDGYAGVGYDITQPIGILREISMVLTGNDPRAKTIDTKTTKAQRRVDGEKSLKEKEMSKKELDALTPDERTKLGEEIAGVLDRFTTDVPEDETRPTAETKDDAPEGEKAEETPSEKEEKKDKLTMPTVIIRDRITQPIIKEEKSESWVTSKDGHIAFAKALKQAGRFNATFDALWRNELSKHMSLDGITGLPTPAAVDRIFEDALEKSDGIISHFNHVNTRSLAINMLAATTAGTSDRAAGFKKGDTKQNQNLTDNVRNVLNKMVYKRLDLDAMELYENPELIDFRARELVDAIIVEIERAAIIGDGRSSGTPDLRMFDGTRGFYSIAADAAASSGIGTYLADKVTRTKGDGLNLYDLTIQARGKIKTEGAQFMVAKSSAVSALFMAKNGDGYLIAPGSSVEDVLKVTRVYTPAWMDKDATNDAYLIVDKAYAETGDSAISNRPEFDTSTNTDVLLAETPRGGSLTKYKSATAINVEPSA